MRPLHLFVAAGDGTLGPDRVFPLPASVKSLFATKVGAGEKKYIFTSHMTTKHCGLLWR